MPARKHLDPDTEHAIREARRQLDEAQQHLYDEILRALDNGAGPSAVAIPAGYTREHISKLGRKRDTQQQTTTAPRSSHAQ